MSTFRKKIKNPFTLRKNAQTEFEYLSGICGSSKTEILIDYCILETRIGKHFLYAVPYTDLCDEIEQRFHKKGFYPKVIHSKNGTETLSVGERIIEEMDKLNPDSLEGVVFIITQQALRNIPYFPNNTPKSIWTVIHDEAIDPTSYIELNLKNHQHYIDGVLSIPKKKWHLDFVPANPRGDMNLTHQRAIIKNKHSDAVYEMLLDFYQHIQNVKDGKCDLFVHMSDYKSFKEGDGNKFTATVVYNPSLFNGFEKVIFAGALFEFTLLFNLWKDFYEVKWVESSLKDKLTLKEHNNPLKVVYVFDDLHWSRYRANQMFEDRRVLDVVNELSRDYFSNSPYPVLFATNKEERKPQDDWIECPYGNLGSNKFREHRNMSYSGAFNHSTPYYNFMKWARL